MVDAQESSGSDSEGRARQLQRQAAGHEETELRRADRRFRVLDPIDP